MIPKDWEDLGLVPGDKESERENKTPEHKVLQSRGNSALAGTLSPTFSCHEPAACHALWVLVMVGGGGGVLSSQEPSLENR